MKKVHGNSGNKNASKPTQKNAQIQLRVLSRKKATYVKQAQRENKKLSAWILDKLDSALDDDL